MGTTLDNGIYLPDEGERNCYDGLAGNWVALDNHLGSTNIHVTINDKQAWNGHVADTTIHVTSADKQAWNGHIADTVKHVTAADKTTWNGHVADTDKHVTASDKTTWNTVTSKANDSDVVHKSGNETIAGVKSFSNDTYVKNINFTKEVASSSVSTTSILQLINTVTYTDETASKVATLNFRITADGVKAFYPNENNQYALGLQSRKWSEVRAIQYYYGSSDVEFSTKFVTTDTAQTVTGGKTFSSHVNVYNSDNTADTPNIILKNSKAEVGTEFTEQSINFVDKNNNALAKINCYGSSGTYTRLYITAYDSNNNSDGVFIRKSTTGTAILPTTSSAVTIGNSIFPYYNIQSKRFNGLEPSSLSLPSDRSARVDISSYFTDTSNGAVNRYTVPANGYVYLNVADVVSMHLLSQTSNNLTQYGDTKARGSVGQLNALLPVRKGDVFACQWYTTLTNVSLTSAYFIPCQGNV